MWIIHAVPSPVIHPGTVIKLSSHLPSYHCRIDNIMPRTNCNTESISWGKEITLILACCVPTTALLWYLNEYTHKCCPKMNCKISCNKYLNAAVSVYSSLLESHKKRKLWALNIDIKKGSASSSPLSISRSPKRRRRRWYSLLGLFH